MKKVLAFLMAVLCLSLTACNSAGGSQTLTDVPTDSQQALWSQKVDEIGVTVENETIVCYHGENEYLEFLKAEYKDGVRVSERVYRIYFDKWWYENRGKPEFEEKEGYAFDDEVWCLQYNSAQFSGGDYGADMKIAVEKLKETYTVKY